MWFDICPKFIELYFSGQIIMYSESFILRRKFGHKRLTKTFQFSFFLLQSVPRPCIHIVQDRLIQPQEASRCILAVSLWWVCGDIRWTGAKVLTQMFTVWSSFAHCGQNEDKTDPLLLGKCGGCFLHSISAKYFQGTLFSFWINSSYQKRPGVMLLLAWNIYGTPKMLYEYHMLITIKCLLNFFSFFLNWSVIAVVVLLQ